MSVVRSSDKVEGSSVGTVMVAGVSGCKVIASVGKIVTMEVASPTTLGSKVTVASTSGIRVVRSTG